jgi:uncharacterized protein
MLLTSLEAAAWTEMPDAITAPKFPSIHFFEVEGSAFVLLPDSSRVFRVTAEMRARLHTAAVLGEESLHEALEECGLAAANPITDEPITAPPVHALSLAVAQKCNLGCTYCYAQEGGFGTKPKNMSLDTAVQAVELLFRNAERGAKLNLSFLGGEPLFNRPVIHAATKLAEQRALGTGTHITFSITTNATLLNADDIAFFEEHGFAVTVSVDGIGDVHDRHRPYKSGAGSFATLLDRVRPALAAQRKMQVSARVTVTPDNLCLPETLDALIGLGFHSVGFSPTLHSPTGRGRLDAGGLAVMLKQMLACGEKFEAAIIAGRRYPFANLALAMRELHRGTHRPYPCGAGVGYFGVSAEGDLGACHRFVNDDGGEMGSLASGIDEERQSQWLASRHVHRQEPCRGCWARYLCSGGCHHEVIHRGRGACDYIRGWLHYALQAYVRLLTARPDYFEAQG